jgi:hypothetical protein
MVARAILEYRGLEAPVAGYAELAPHLLRSVVDEADA